MIVQFLKDYNGHKKGELFECGGMAGRWLINNGKAKEPDVKFSISTNDGKDWKEVTCCADSGLKGKRKVDKDVDPNMN